MRPAPSVSTLKKYFARASLEFGVPTELLEVVGQIENNWAQVGPSIDQGWGIMHLVQNNYCDTLGDAANLLGVSEQTLKDNAEANIRGGAALIAYYAGKDRKVFREFSDWAPALAKFSGLVSPELREAQAENYLQTLAQGVRSQTVWGEEIRVDGVAIGDTLSQHRIAALQPRSMSADYSPALTNNAATCNYLGGRNHSIDTWVNHWIGTGTYLGTISWFQTCPGTGPGQRGAGIGASSAHFVIKNSNGEITQMVSVSDSAYHCGAAGQLYNNGRSIGVEHEATAANPGLWNSAAMLNASATMARYFKNQYGFPATQNSSPGICGHNDMPGTSTDCPGPLPWSTWMSYFNAGGGGAPSNDDCSSATQLISNTSCSYTTGSVLNATASGLVKPSCDNFGSPNMFDVWYKFVAVSASQTVTVDPSTGDPVVSVYGSCGGAPIGCSDSGGQAGTETLSLTGLVVGNTYYIRIYDYGSSEPVGAEAEFQVCVTGTPATNYTLLVTGSGTGQGTVTGSGINCTVNAGSTSGTCSANFPSGSAVSLSATPTGGSTFGGWSGACAGTGGCSFTINATTSVSASFTAPVTNYTLSVTGAGTGQGTVTGTGINCTISGGNMSGTCSASYASGTGVSLTATPTGGSTFNNWGGSCSGSGGCSVTMNAAKNVSASFTAPVTNYTLSLTGAGTGQGTVTGTGINCTISAGSTSGTCSASYASGTNVSLTATPSGSSTFGGWAGEGCGGVGGCQVTMTQARSVTATFTSGAGGGSDLIVNGGFESATASGFVAPGWGITPSPGTNHWLIIKSGPYGHAGVTYASLGGENFTEYDWLMQTATIPANATAANLTAWINVTTQEALGDSVYDVLWVALYDINGNLITTLRQLSNQDAIQSNNTLGNYLQVGPFDLSAYKGSSVQVAFVAFTDSTLPTTFLIDDVSLQVSTPSDNPPTTSITAPANGATVSGTVNVAATAADDHAVTSLEIDIDGAAKTSIANSTSLNYSWNTTLVSNGQHQIYSKANDGAGHVTTSSSVVVTVSNTTLAVTRSGTGSGGVTSSPAGINCGTTCQFNFAFNTQVTLTATAVSGSTFSGWSGACSGASSQCTVTMSQAQNVTATFDQPSPVATGFYLLTPCRLIDTRNADGSYGGPSLTANTTRNVATAGVCGIPAGINALSVNITSTGAGSSGWLTLFPGPVGASMPFVSTINYSSGKTLANNAVVRVGSDGTINIYNSGPVGVHCIVDVNGYFK